MVNDTTHLSGLYIGGESAQLCVYCWTTLYSLLQIEDITPMT